ncbi:TetR/AcrR family transcriptional regulator [Gorillibacterium sp. sgz500922]|uniref:TetR/AcrR family transcriptional regulator n=1 Tax=Gorillibacterium sp. sgz500922 TaxID=3446694 RepID=UPI003F670B41
MEAKKQQIYDSGKDLFSTRGFKETNISDITRKAGVAVGTFYNYFPSKEKLFLEIFLEENVKLKHRLMDDLDFNDEPLPLVKTLLSRNLEGMIANPILKQWYNKDVFAKLERQYREDNGVGEVDFLYGSFADLFRRWQEEGKIRHDLNVELIMALFTAIITVDTHKEEVGVQHFPQLLDYLTEFVMKGLAENE